MEIFMAKIHISPNRTTDKTIRAIDRKREQERKQMFTHAKENAEAIADHNARIARRGLISDHFRKW